MRQSLSTLLALRARVDLPLEVPHSATAPRQLVRGGDVGFVRNRDLRRELARRGRAVADIIAEDTRLEVKPLRALRTARGRSVLFLLPSDALGDAVMYAGAIREIGTAFAPNRMTVAFTGKASDVFAHVGRECELYPLFLPRRVVRQHEVVVDFESDLPGLHRVAEELVPIDRLVLEHLALNPAYAWQAPRPARHIRRVGLFPLSSTPLRTLPPTLTAFLHDRLTALGYEVELVLDGRQRQGALCLQALRAASPGARPRINLDSVEALLGMMTGLDYGVFCDSGPAHLAKMLSLPGYGIYTTVSAATVQGHFTNLTPWQAPYRGAACQAPCGLVGVMARRERPVYGCMDSLASPRADLVRPAVLPEAETRRFLLDDPVGCVATLVADRHRILAGILADMTSRSSPAGGVAAALGAHGRPAAER